MTPAEVEEFQRAHRNHLGAPLTVDGRLGPETQWALDFETLCLPRRQFILTAQKSLGLVEHPPASNDDPKGIIRGWLTHCGAQPGDPWCASAICAWLGMVDVRIPGALRLCAHFPTVLQPIAGDIGAYPTNATGNGHVFAVIGANAYEVMTLEGNSSNAVRCCRRGITPSMRFSRPFADVSGRCPGVVPSVALAPSATR